MNTAVPCVHSARAQWLCVARNCMKATAAYTTLIARLPRRNALLAVVHWLPVSKAEPPPAPIVQRIPEPPPPPPVEQSAERRITREQLEIISRAAGVGIWDWDLRSGRIAAVLHMTQKLDAAAHDF